MAWKWEKDWMPAKESLGKLNFIGLEPLGLCADLATGLFVKPDKLLEFVALNPDFHIISSFERPQGDLLVNRYCPGAKHYFLANGIKDPNFEVQTENMTPEEMAGFFQHLAERAAREGAVDDDGVLLSGAVKVMANSEEGRPLFEDIEDRKKVVDVARKIRKSALPRKAVKRRRHS